jgi:hypothetical protein
MADKTPMRQLWVQLRDREAEHQLAIGLEPDLGKRLLIRSRVAELNFIRESLVEPLVKAQHEARLVTRSRGAGERSETERYELVYGLGGHGGPYLGYTAAFEAAKALLLGSKSEHVIYVVPYSAPTFERIHAVDEVRRLLG